MTFVQRALGFTFQLGTGSFGNGGYNTLTAPAGLWANVEITKNGVPSMASADITILGLQYSTLQKLSRIGLLPTAVRNNIITVTAGEVGGNMSLVFAGGIKESWPDFSNPTEAALKVSAFTGMLAQMKPVAPLSFSGGVDVAKVMGQLAQQMGYTLENNGVSVQVRDVYLPNTARMQALALAEAAGIYLVFDDDNGVMAILPSNGARSQYAPTVSPIEGLNGYPTYVGPGQIGFKTEYNNQFRFMGNAVVQNSVVPGANGTWRITGLRHSLSTMPDGPWFSNIVGNNNYTAGS